MTAPRNHNIERVSGQPLFLKATWDFSDGEFSGTNRNFQVIGADVDRGSVSRAYTVPSNDQCWSDSDPQKRDEGYVILPELFYPSTRVRLSHVDHHVQMQGHGSPDDGRTDIATFSYAEPVPPEVKMTRDGRKLTFEIDAKLSDMSDTSKHYRTGTRFWFQSRTEGQAWQNIEKYSRIAPTGDFSGDKHTYVKNNAVDRIAPARAIMFRLVAMNVGPSGCSEPPYSIPVHVFGVVKPPTVRATRVYDDRVELDTSLNETEFHPVDAAVLERGKGLSANTVSYDPVSEEKRDDIGNYGQMTDRTSTQMPGEDEAVFYRVMTYHDDKGQNVAYGYANNPVRAGNPKAPTNVRLTTGSTTLVEWNNASVCSPNQIVTLYVKPSATDAVRKYTYTETDGAQGEKSHRFDVDTTANAWSVYATVQAVKTWGGVAGTTNSAVAKSPTAVIPTMGEITLLEDGLSVRVSETHEYDGWDYTEYSWHTRADGWESTDEPKTHKVADATNASHVVIVGLDDGVEYFVRCRRYQKSTDSYGLYSSIVSTRTGSTPGTPVLMAPASVAAGRGIEFSWDFQGATQSEAVLTISHRLKREDSFAGDGTVAEFELTYVPDGTPTVTVDDVETDEFTLDGSTLALSTAPDADSVVRAVYMASGGGIDIPIDGSDMGYVYQTEDSWEGDISATVAVTCGGKWSGQSEAVAVAVVQPPTCTAEPSGDLVDGEGYRGLVLESLPLTLELGGTGDMWEVTIATANATNEPTPAGDDRVPAGSVVWTSRIGTPGVSDIVSRPGVIATGGQYDVTVVCVDSATGSRSEPLTLGFTARWASPALEPSISVDIVDGRAHVTASRDESDDTSTLSLWRRTADGAIRCVSDAGDGIEYTDEVPPYEWSGCAYIAMVMTTDGDIRWTEARYTYANNGLTLDFDGSEVTLPFNIGFDDGYRNTFESRAHLDGHRSGYWEPGVDRTASVSGQLPKALYGDTVYALRQLGRYSGIAFVRDVLGIAFPCHVDVSVSNSYEEGKWDIDLSITEVDDDGTWALTAGAVPKEGE